MPPLPASTAARRKAALVRQGATIAAARRSAGLSQPEAALALGVDVWRLRSWEQGKRGCPGQYRVRVIALWGGDRKALGVNPPWPPGCCSECGRPF